MIFQEPMTSLNPVLTIGRQITEVLRLHERLSAKTARIRAIELLDLVRIPDPRTPDRRLPASAFGRDASTRDDCDCCCLPAAPAHR